MSKRSSKSVEEKLESIQLYLNHKYSLSQLKYYYQVSDATIRQWVNRYKQSGIDGLKGSQTWQTYSKELKDQAVQDYLNGRESQYEICSQIVFLTYSSFSSLIS